MLPSLFVNSVSSMQFDGADRKRDVERALKESLPKAPRRLNTFIKTALLGASACVKEEVLQSADVYLCSKAVSHEVMVDLVNSATVDMEPPKPVSFIHSIGNSANFYISQLLNIPGESLFVVEDEDCLAHMSLLSALKMQVGTTNVLLGSVTQDKDFIRTSWLWLSNNGGDQSLGEISLLAADSQSTEIENEKFELTLFEFCEGLKQGVFPSKLHSNRFIEQSGYQLELKQVKK